MRGLSDGLRRKQNRYKGQTEEYFNTNQLCVLAGEVSLVVDRGKDRCILQHIDADRSEERRRANIVNMVANERMLPGSMCSTRVEFSMFAFG